ncbi:polyamine transporter 1 [Cryptococcus deuterogattii 99/473]|uniref:Unplaced genomic scaffold supercont1.4, whole genome shotgun sequence n=1 Tax=Cryptococcus deuterogattii Ram5 TaxID=1296110 RepID=A0A0D0U0Q4_9TREE|nr:polyamine transporter 1 [Cryptococcus deuterogattii Ram5]KIY60098.1 polyamine transporter 1 [Cryptococcus deuterogattii 99/473]
MASNSLELGPEIGSHPAHSTPSSTASSDPHQATDISHSEDRQENASRAPHSLPPNLEHTYSAPVTVPSAAAAEIPVNVNPFGHGASATDEKHEGAGQFGESRHGRTGAPAGGSDESPTPTLNSMNVARAAHAAGVKPLTGHEEGYDINEKDHQAGMAGGKTGPEVAMLAAKDLGLTKEGQEEANEEAEHPSPLMPTRKVARTASGTKHETHIRTASGGRTAEGLGMVPLIRQISSPPAVSPFGGVAPSGTDAERGLRAARSREQEEERQLEIELKGPDPWSVSFEPGESINPKNWGVGYRWFLTSLAGLLVLNSTFASSAPSGIIQDMIITFGFGQEVAVLTISLFVAGYCVGPIIWGPLSESYGRRPVFIGSFFVYTCFQVGCALSKNTASILVFRFLGGTFAAAPLTNSGALVADIWDGDNRGRAMSLFALAPFVGPSVGPIVSGFIQVSGTSWRWVFWILTIFAGVCLALIIFFVPETYAPKILAQKAKRLRKDTQEERWYAPLEKQDHSFKARMNDILLKPFIILALEPMLLAVTLYMSFVYGLVYLLFEAYPFVFERNHGFNAGEEGLAFLGFFSGGCICVLFWLFLGHCHVLVWLDELCFHPLDQSRFGWRFDRCWCAGHVYQFVQLCY